MKPLLVVALIAVTITAACQGHRAPQPPVLISFGPPPKPAATNLVVLLDTQFTAEEAERVVKGFDTWPDAVGADALGLHYGWIESPAEKTAPRGVAYVVRGTSIASLVAPCQSPNDLGCWCPTPRRMWIAINACGGRLASTIAAHELGHILLGPEHRKPPSVLGENSDIMAPRPSQGDVEAYCALWPCPL